MDKLSSLKRALLTFIFSGRNSIMFIILMRHLSLLENNALILYADPILIVYLCVVREKLSLQISAGILAIKCFRRELLSATGSCTKPEEKSSVYHEEGGSGPVCLLMQTCDLGWYHNSN